MFPNLEAEQKRSRLTNKEVAHRLGINRNTYELKKRKGEFTRSQIVMLCNLFNSDFEYLFNTNASRFTSKDPPRSTA